MTNQPTPKRRPLDPSRPLADLLPSRFLRVDDLTRWGVSEITVTIADVVEEEVQPKPGKAEWKPVIYFLNRNGQKHKQGYLLSARVDRDALATATGAATIGDLIGKRITIHLDTWRGKAVLRISPTPPAPPAQEGAE